MRATRKRRLDGGLACLVLLAGCGLAAHAPAPEPRALFLPLTPGNEWAYEVRNAAGEVANLHVRVRGERYIPSRGAEAMIVEESGGVPGSSSFETTTDLVAYYLRGGFLFRSPWLIARDADLEDRGAELGDERLLPLDPQSNPTWESRYALFDFASEPLYEFQTSSRLVPVAEDVRVPAGVFRRCVRVETRVLARTANPRGARTIIHDYLEWYAPGVGLVQSQSFVEEGDSRFEVGTAALVSFRIRDRP